MTSILDSIKRLLGIEPDYTHFDPDITISINSALMVLNQLGVGPSEGFVVTGPDENWEELVGTRKDIESIKTYVYLKTRLLFDPPSSSFVVDAFERQLREMEVRLNIQMEGGVYVG